MKKKPIEYSKGEIGEVKIIKDVLPAPSELVLEDDNVKDATNHSNRSITVFMRDAKK